MAIEICMCRPESIKLMQEWFGGRVWFVKRIESKETWAGRWFWHLDSDAAANVLSLMLPFLVIKRDEAIAAIEFQQLKLKHQSGRSFKVGLSQEEISQRESYKQKLHSLKRIHWERQADYEKSACS